MARATSFEELAADAAERVNEARAMGQQLSLLPDEGPAAGQAPARATRGEGKAQSQLRRWAAARGFRMPEDVLAEMALMATTDDVFTAAMARAEQVLAWAEAGDTGGRPASLTMRVDTFRLIYTAALRAAEAALPYGLAKVTPDVVNAPAVQVVVMPGQPGQPAPTGPETARDVTPRPHRMAPPPMPGQVQQNQGLSPDGAGHSDAEIRTERVKP